MIAWNEYWAGQLESCLQSHVKDPSCCISGKQFFRYVELLPALMLMWEVTFL